MALPALGILLSGGVGSAIADWIGANLDTTTSVCHGPSGMAFQGVGEVTFSWHPKAGLYAEQGYIFWASTRSTMVSMGTGGASCGRAGAG